MRHQFGGILFATIVFCILVIGVLFSGCVTNNNAKEMRLAVPAMFEYRMEYYETGGSETKIGPIVPKHPNASDELELPKFNHDD